jgi:hypothetical protein
LIKVTRGKRRPALLSLDTLERLFRGSQWLKRHFRQRNREVLSGQTKQSEGQLGHVYEGMVEGGSIARTRLQGA